MSKLVGENLILLTAVISGVSIFLNSYAVKGFDSSVFTFAKNILVAILLFSILLIYTKFDEIKKLTKKQWTQLILVGFVGGSVPFLLFFKGMQMTTGTTASFIHKTIFVYVLLLSIWLLKEKLNLRKIIGVTILLLGTYLMIRPELTVSTGHLFVFGAVLFWSIEYILSKKLLRNISGNIVAWGRMFFGSIFILIFLLLTNKVPIIFSMNITQYYWILLTSALLLLYVITFYNGLNETTATNAAAILTLGAPITVILSWITGAVITLNDALGITFTLIGVMIIVYYSALIKLFVGDEVND